MPVEGDPITQEAQDVFITVLQSASAADGNGTIADVAGLDGTLTVEIINSTAGTATITFEGSYDGVNWYTCGYAPFDNQATITRTVSPIAVTGNSAHCYVLLDYYTRFRARQSSSASAPSITATLRGMAL